MCIDEELYEELVTAMETTGWFGANAWYMNHDRNKVSTLFCSRFSILHALILRGQAYFEEKAENEGFLHMPTLFIEGRYDHICAIGGSTIADAQRKYCTNLTEVSLASGHWIPQEKPAEVNAAIVRWLIQSCPNHWPGFWSSGYVTNKAKPER
jgi:soluble epoxide hydrolase/lipid-phosphate phosphatase